MTIWDTGTYETEKWRDDEVIVDLDGQPGGPLGGAVRVALIRTDGSGEKSSWLLHRMKDQRPGHWSTEGGTRTSARRASAPASRREDAPKQARRRRSASGRCSPRPARVGMLARRRLGARVEVGRHPRARPRRRRRRAPHEPQRHRHHRALPRARTPARGRSTATPSSTARSSRSTPRAGPTSAAAAADGTHQAARDRRGRGIRAGSPAAVRRARGRRHLGDGRALPCPPRAPRRTRAPRARRSGRGAAALPRGRLPRRSTRAGCSGSRASSRSARARPTGPARAPTSG